MVFVRRSGAVVLILCQLIILGQSKICVLTAKNTYLCTDDASKARMAAMNTGNEDYFDHHVDYGVAQKVDGNASERAAVEDVLNQMKAYVRNEIFAKTEDDVIRDRWYV